MSILPTNLKKVRVNNAGVMVIAPIVDVNGDYITDNIVEAVAISADILVLNHGNNEGPVRAEESSSSAEDSKHTRKDSTGVSYNITAVDENFDITPSSITESASGGDDSNFDVMEGAFAVTPDQYAKYIELKEAGALFYCLTVAGLLPDQVTVGGYDSGIGKIKGSVDGKGSDGWYELAVSAELNKTVNLGDTPAITYTVYNTAMGVTYQSKDHAVENNKTIGVTLSADEFTALNGGKTVLSNVPSSL